MNPLNWKKEVTKKGMPFLKKFAGKVKRRFKPDLDDIHDAGDVHKHTETPGLLEKGIMLGVDLSNPVSGAIALAQQSNPGEFVHDVSTSLPELPAVGGFQIGHNPETDIGRRVGQFLQNRAIAIGQGIQQGYEDYQLARDYDELERGLASLTPSSIPVTQSTTHG